MRTARRSTSGGLELSACARATRELPARVPMSAVTNPAPPAHSRPRREMNEALGSKLHGPNNMSKSSLSQFSREPRAYASTELASCAREGKRCCRASRRPISPLDVRLGTHMGLVERLLCNVPTADVRHRVPDGAECVNRPAETPASLHREFLPFLREAVESRGDAGKE